MKDDREVVWSYGGTFDDLVGEVANAMTAFGHPSRHARPTRHQAGPAELRSAIVALGMFCEKLDTALRGGSSLTAHRPSEPAGFLAVYASARRLIILFREAEDSGVLTGLVTAETFGDVDNVEELLLRLDDPDAIVEATESLVAVSVGLQDLLPAAVRDGVHELERLLRPAG
jgi:hypothetical protein